MRGKYLIAALLLTTPAQSAETITYTYDARGRVIKVERTGSVNNNVKYEYQFDKADNRKKVKVTNSPNLPQ